MTGKPSTWTVKKLESLNAAHKVNVDLEIQRNKDIWNTHQKSLLIHSLLMGKAIPPLYVNVAGNVNEVIDGKQRICNIVDFVHGVYALAEDTPDINDTRIGGLNYSELTEEMRETLLNRQLEIYKYEGLSDAEKEDLFFRLNNGSSLKPIENTRVILGTKNMKVVSELAKHPFFGKTKLSDKRYVDQETILQIVMLMNNSSTGFSSKEIRQYVLSLKGSNIPDAQVNKVKETLAYMDKGFEKKQKFIRKLHFPMIFAVALKALERDVEPEYFSMWVIEFYDGLKENSEYYDACQSGSAKKENVQKRLSAITRAFDEQFAGSSASIITLNTDKKDSENKNVAM